MAAATANAGIMFTNLFRIKLICHELDYVKILGNMPLILSFGKSNNWYQSAVPSGGPTEAHKQRPAFEACAEHAVAGARGRGARAPGPNGARAAGADRIRWRPQQALQHAGPTHAGARG
jgi:hypothetical protein